eukprot:TRINITY_DN2169_c0_g1_i1.p1 TRINITY_DN2169_c0_g1~~TRINITY_DN2169_c0_g1_i1.p1  ORF type:complete len:918 (-),score=256.83 TRINITY_DN2169_c0_g1_i1:213-2966(-)
MDALFAKGSVRMRELIKAVRSCKTAAEERAVIAKECANIRTAFRDESNDYRHRNVAKLLFIQMLGYPTHFGQMECLKLIVSSNYFDKRVGYLGLMLLLDEKQEVLTLVTNSLKNDLNHPSQFVVGLALCAIANISSPGIARDLAPEIEKLMQSTNSYLKKKATICAVRIIRKVPELIENFVPKIKPLLGERNHGVLISTLSLMTEICVVDPSYIEQFRKLVPNLVRILKSLVLSGYAPEYDVSGVTDPFLQVKILRMLGFLAKGSKDASDSVNDILAQVATNTEGGRNVGNSILYECVLTIMSIESEGGLRVLAINQLGRFLLNRDNNIRYVALNTLTKVVNVDTQAVQRHRNTIVDCLKDNDISIRKRALDLVYALVNDTNAQSLVPELLDFLERADTEIKPELVTKICVLAERYAPNLRWRLDTLLRVLSLAGNFIPDDAFANLVALVGQNADLQPYAVQKLYVLMTKELIQQPLVQLGVWSIGEFGQHLRGRFTIDTTDYNVADKDLLDLLDTIQKYSATTILTKEYLLTALVKLGDRLKNDPIVRRIRDMLEYYATNLNAELQQRACEYITLLNQPNDLRSKILEVMPAMEMKATATNVPATKTETQNGSGSSSAAPTPSLISDIHDLLGGPITSGPSTPSLLGGGGGGAPAPGGDLLSDIFGSPSPSPAVAKPSASKPYAPLDPFASQGSAENDLLSLLSSPSPAAPSIGNPSPFGGPAAPMVGGPSPIFGGAPLIGGPAPLIGGPAPLIGGPAPLIPGGPAPLIPGGPAPLLPSNSLGAPLSQGKGPSAPGTTNIVAYDKNGLTISFAFSKQPNNNSIIVIEAQCYNSLSVPITNFVFLTALPKYIKLVQMPPPSSTTIPPNNSGSVHQTIKIQNTLQGQKPVLMKIKLEYVANGEKTETTADVFNFPSDL